MTRLSTGLAYAVFLVAAAVFASSVVETSTAQVNAVTGTSSFLSVGTVSLDTSVAATDLLFDVRDMRPGQVVDGCVDVTYGGSIPGSIRLHGRPAGQSGLEPYIDLVVTKTADGGTCAPFDRPDGPEGPDRLDGSVDQLFIGTLADLLQANAGYETGLQLVTGAEDGDGFAIRVTAELQDDNQAQGLVTDFVLTIEVQP